MARHRTFNPARVGSSPTAPTNAGARRPRDQGTGLLNRGWQFESARALQFTWRTHSCVPRPDAWGRLLVPLPANTLHEVLQRPAGDFVEFLATHLQAADAVKPEDAEVFARLAPRRYRPRRTPKIERQRIQRPG